MVLSLSNSSSLRFPQNDFLPRLHNCSRPGSFHTFSNNKSISPWRSLIWRQHHSIKLKAQSAIDGNSSGDKHGDDDDDFIIEDVPHLTHFLPDLPSHTNPLKRSQAYAIVKKTFVNPEDMVAKEIIVQKDSARGIHFRRAGPREKVFFTPEEVRACIVTCGGLCPGINTVIREIVCGLKNMYGVDDVLGIQDCCLIPESPFYLEGPGGLYEYVEQQLKENRHVLIVLAEGAGQEYVAQSMQAFQEKDASGNRLLLDVGLWLTQHIKDHFTNVRKMTINMKYIGCSKKSITSRCMGSTLSSDIKVASALLFIFFRDA